MTKTNIDFPIEGFVGHVEDRFPTGHANDVDETIDATIDCFGVGSEFLRAFTGGDISDPRNTGGTNFRSNFRSAIGINVNTHNGLGASLHECVRSHASHADTSTGNHKGATIDAKAGKEIGYWRVVTGCHRTVPFVSCSLIEKVMPSPRHRWDESPVR